jgi:hypothetical protein
MTRVVAGWKGLPLIFVSSRFAVLGFWHQCAGGANGGAGAALVAGEVSRVSPGEESDFGIEAPLGQGQEVVAIFLAANVDALTAKHAAEGIVGEESEVDLVINLAFEDF